MKSKVLCFLAGLSICLGAFAIEPVVSAITATRGDDQFLRVSYTLANAPAVITFDVTTNGVSVGPRCLERVFGGCARLMRPGTHEISWRPDRDLPGVSFENGEADVQIRCWPTNAPPDYLVLDLVSSNATYYVSADWLPRGGLANREYATRYLVMRRIPAAGRKWHMGVCNASTSHDVTLGSDYYMAVYELTDGQYSRINGEAGGTAKPHSESYKTYRGETLLWPGDGHAVDEGFFIDKVRKLTGFELDMPTEAQWEIAARAGANGPIYGESLDAIAWYGDNSQVDGVCALHEVGLKEPNAFGLYDVLGNAFEFALDWQSALTNAEAVDPVGATTGTQRVRRGGGYNLSATYCSLDRQSDGNQPTYANDGLTGVDGSTKAKYQSIRLVCPAVAVR